MNKKAYIVGAGFTGLAAGLSSRFKIFEAENHPGGICYSYSKNGFKFERGGGHWIFGGDKDVIKIIKRFSKFKMYKRRAGIFFAGNLEETKKFKKKFFPYPIQNNLSYMGKEMAVRILKEILNKPNKEVLTMNDWLLSNFGKSLYNIFFKPFHERYTAGMYKKIAPQDVYKSPFNISDVIDGIFGINKREVGYNTKFLYPTKGLNSLAEEMAKKCDIDYCKRLKKINIKEKKIVLSDGTVLGYDYLISTIPLNNLIKITGIDRIKLPYTSVLVLNMGVKLGNSKIAKHDYHWLYIPDSKSGFHRIGYYSNVDSRVFLPKGLSSKKYGSLYIEFSFKGGKKPSVKKLEKIKNNTIEELKDYGFIKEAIVTDFTWIDVGYTWETPNSRRVHEVINKLKDVGIYSIGRFGGWNFQGIAKSIKEGFSLGKKLKKDIK